MSDAEEETKVRDEPEPQPPEIKPDPVVERQQSLWTQVRDPVNAEETAFRKANLLRRVEGLRQIGNMRRALRW